MQTLKEHERKEKEKEEAKRLEWQRDLKKMKNRPKCCDCKKEQEEVDQEKFMRASDIIFQDIIMNDIYTQKSRECSPKNFAKSVFQNVGAHDILSYLEDYQQNHQSKRRRRNVEISLNDTAVDDSTSSVRNTTANSTISNVNNNEDEPLFNRSEVIVHKGTEIVLRGLEYFTSYKVEVSMF